MINTISLQLPNFLHKQVLMIAEKEQVSVDQFAILALAEKISALTTYDYLTERASRGSREKFMKAMSKVSNREPEEKDRI